MQTFISTSKVKFIFIILITREIFGYSHDICNSKVKECKLEIPLIARNLFGFDMFYFFKGYRASAWSSKDLNFGGNNLTNINFGNTGSEIKFVSTLKYYQKCLGELASTLTEGEKQSVRTLTSQILNQRYYFTETWKLLSSKINSVRHNFRRKRYYSIWKNC